MRRYHLILPAFLPAHATFTRTITSRHLSRVVIVLLLLWPTFGLAQTVDQQVKEVIEKWVNPALSQAQKDKASRDLLALLKGNNLADVKTALSQELTKTWENESIETRNRLSTQLQRFAFSITDNNVLNALDNVLQGIQIGAGDSEVRSRAQQARERLRPELFNLAVTMNTPLAFELSLDHNRVGEGDSLLITSSNWRIAVFVLNLDGIGGSNDLLVGAEHLVVPPGDAHAGEVAPNENHPFTAIFNVVPGGAGGPSLASVEHAPNHHDNLFIEYLSLAGVPGTSALVINVKHRDSPGVHETPLPLDTKDPFTLTPDRRERVPGASTAVLLSVGIAALAWMRGRPQRSRRRTARLSSST
jgi:hypothetical protein